MNDDDESQAALVDRLILENRQLHKTLDILHQALFDYKDLSKLSLEGALVYLMRHKKLLDEVQHLLKKANRNPAQSHLVLDEIAILLEHVA